MNFYTIVFWVSLDFPVEVEIEALDEEAALGQAIDMNPELRHIEASIVIDLERDCS